MNKKCIIFHHNDADGYAAGYVAMKYEGERGKYNYIETEVLDYSTEFPIEKVNKDDKVYIVDYSIEPNEMINLLKITKNVIWIDHHISAIEKYDDEWLDLITEATDLDGIKGLRVNGISGCALTWLYCCTGWNENALQELRDTSINEEEVCKILTEDFEDLSHKYLIYINGWDIWKHDFPESEQLQIAISNILSMDLIMSLDHDTNNTLLKYFIEKGKNYIEYRDMWSSGFMKRYGFETVIEDLNGRLRPIYVANLGNANSKFFGDLINQYDAVVTMCFDGEKWNFSIYSVKEDFDCSQIASYFGGGGHKGAAGFSLNEPFTKSTIFTKSARG